MRYGSSALGCVRQVTTLLALTLLAAVLAAQDYRGRIQGVVRDSSEGRPSHSHHNILTFLRM